MRSRLGSLSSLSLGSVNLALLSFYFFPVWGRDAVQALLSPYNGLNDRVHATAAIYFSQLFDLSFGSLVVASHVLAGVKLVIAAAFVAYIIEFARSWAIRPRAGPGNGRRRPHPGGCRHPVARSAGAGAGRAVDGSPLCYADVADRGRHHGHRGGAPSHARAETVAPRHGRARTRSVGTWLAGRRVGGRSAAGADGRRPGAHSGSALAQPVGPRLISYGACPSSRPAAAIPHGA